MEDFFHIFRKFRKPSKGDQSYNLDALSPEAAEAKQQPHQAKFKLKRPRLSPTERKILGRKSKERHSLDTASTASVSSEVVATASNNRPGSPFADEDDLFADRDQDDGVYMQSSSSSSPTASTSERLRPQLQPQPHQQSRPVSCTFGREAGLCNSTFLNPSQEYSRPASVCSMVSALVIQDQGQCPVCNCHYDSGKLRKLVDTNCGHARCFKCMFAIESCPLCSMETRQNASSSTGVAKNGKSCISRESGFQSFNGSLNSVYSSGMMGGGNNIEFDRQSSTGSLLSLMSAQSALNMMAPPPIMTSRFSMYDSASSSTSSSFLRQDQKRHSLSSLGRFQNQPHMTASTASIGSRNSFVRRSAIIPRNNRRLMTSIIENAAPIENENWPLKPLFFEIPARSSTTFVGRKWLFREVLEHLSSDLPTSGGMIIQGAQATGKSSIILRLVQGSFFGHQAPCMSNCIDILARDVVAFHFCQLDDEPTCTIPEFVHNLAAQLCKSPQLSSFKLLLQQNPDLLAQLTYLACLENPSRALVKGILEPLALLRSQGKISGQKCLLLIDSLCDAEYHRSDSGETLASFIGSHLHFFPRWLRMICTVRSNMIDVMKPFPFHRLSLDNLSVDERIYKDIQDLVFQRIRESLLIQKNITPINVNKPEEVKASQTNFAHYVIQASRGNFLYVDLVLNFFKEGKLQVKSASFGMIPLTLSEVFLLAFNLKFSTQEAFQKVKDIICIMAASLRPLTHQELFDCICALKQEPITQPQFREKLLSLGWLVKTKANGTLAFFHPSVRDWLIGRRSTADSNVFICDPREGHAAIALKLSRQRPKAGLDGEQTLELGHHLLKANLFCRGSSPSKDLQAAWIAMVSEDTTSALAHVKNLSSPNVKVSRLLLLSGASPEGLIHKFASSGNLEMIQLLVEFGANLSSSDNQGVTPLMKAAREGHFEAAAMLVKSGAEINSTDSKGSTALVYAARSGFNDLLQLLLSCQWPLAGCSLQVTAREALIVAAKEGHLDVLETLINALGDVNQPCGLSGEVALCTAALHGQLASCQCLIKGQADVNVVTEKNGLSPLFLAVKEGHYDIVDLLLNNGAKVEGCSGSSLSPVAVAAGEGQVGVLELLLTRKADIEAVDEEGLTPVAFAVIKGQSRAVDLLIKAGANVAVKDKNQRTLLHHASMVKNNSKLAEMILGCSLDIEAMDKDGIRAIDLAISHNNEVMVANLLRKGAKLGPTTWAMAKGKPRIALTLLNKLLEDGNMLFRKGRLTDAAYRYEYALRRLPRLRPDAASASAASEDIFAQMKSHLLLNLSRTKRKMGNLDEAEECAKQVLTSRPQCHEAWWARAKVRADKGQFQEALGDLREALKLAPQNMQLHAFSLQVKTQLEAIQTKEAVLEAANSVLDEDEILTISEEEIGLTNC